MKIFDAVYTAAVFLQLDSLCDGLNAEGFDAAGWRAELSGEDAAELDILLRCCDLVLCELSEEFPLLAAVNATAQDGRIDYGVLPQFTHIYKVESGNKRVPFREYHDGIHVQKDGAYTVTYAYAPPKAVLSGDSPYAGNTPSARLTAYGIAREYCVISGMQDEAALWDARFTACAQSESRPRKSQCVRQRVWS